MELRKALEILNYPGDMWYIHPYVVNGSIVRNTVFKVNRNRRSDDWGRFTFDDMWGKVFILLTNHQILLLKILR